MPTDFMEVTHYHFLCYETKREPVLSFFVE